MILKLSGKLWNQRIQPRFTIPDYVYAKRRHLFRENLPDVTCHYPLIHTQRNRKLVQIILELPRRGLISYSPDRCTNCHSVNAGVVHPREGIKVCRSCGLSSQDLSSADMGSYTQSFGLPQSVPSGKP